MGVSPIRGTKLPDDWTTIRIQDYWNVRGQISGDLRLRRRKDSPNIQGEFLPLPEEDPRPNLGRGNNGKRLTIRNSLRTSDPYTAAEKAVVWNKQVLNENKILVEEGADDSEFSVEAYFQKWFAEESRTREKDTTQNFQRWKNDNQSFWDLNFVQSTFDSDGNIVYDPSWIKKHISKATKRHLKNIERKIHNRVVAKTKGKTTGTGTKEQAKTLWNKLVEIAELEIDGHAFPTFPKFDIDKTPECSHLRVEQFKAVLDYIISASNGACTQSLTEEEYYNLPHKFQNKLSTRNWVDLYDAVMVQWFFFTRSQDMKRISPYMFSVVEGDEDKVIFRIKGKTGLEKETENYRNGATAVVSKILKRKGNLEYLVFPDVDRSTQKSGVDVKLNALLKHAINEVCPDYRGDLDWTMMRHTTFRLTFEEDEDLQKGKRFKEFAANAHTSTTMLDRHYLKPLRDAKAASKSRKKIGLGAWGKMYLKKRVK
tara:strand:+ start:169 stop:1614 length:1446 start_codon:yes stop_codon:yes gene_type:complete